MPRFASGEPALIARALRTTVAGVVGGDFAGALPMAWLLLIRQRAAGAAA